MKGKRKIYGRIFPVFLMAAWIFAAACTNEKEWGTNTFLGDLHAGYPDCVQSGCHRAYGAAGSVFSDSNGQSRSTGVQIQMKNLSTNEITLLPKTDGLGNFYSVTSIPDGFYSMYGGNSSVVAPSTEIHRFPGFGYESCNRCHVPGGKSYQGSGITKGTIKWTP